MSNTLQGQLAKLAKNEKAEGLIAGGRRQAIVAVYSTITIA